jgi:hypothetical protein
MTGSDDITAKRVGRGEQLTDTVLRAQNSNNNNNIAGPVAISAPLQRQRGMRAYRLRCEGRRAFARAAHFPARGASWPAFFPTRPAVILPPPFP